MQKVVVFWFRRDLRLQDNTALNLALKSKLPVLPLFIFDDLILEQLPSNDARVNFIYDSLQKINQTLKQTYASGLLIKKGEPLQVFQQLTNNYNIAHVYCNKDYEPYAKQRDSAVKIWLQQNKIGFSSCKDQVIFEKDEILKKDGKAYTVYTPYKNKWLEEFTKIQLSVQHTIQANFFSFNSVFPNKKELKIQPNSIQVKPYKLNDLKNYGEQRDFPSQDSGSYLSVHLRFGTVSIREIVQKVKNQSDDVFLSELIWREFFMQILHHFPHVVNQEFKAKYKAIEWRNNQKEFDLWRQGKTGYPMVDAGMQQLNQTGYMHNRVRMVTASFLCKHLLIDWRWGEAYFAQKLLDFELSSNNGNWQWAAGCGCDAAPYFRIFNPITQLKKFDANGTYTKQWLPNLNTLDYPLPMVNHKMARERCLAAYKKALNNI